MTMFFFFPSYDSGYSRDIYLEENGGSDTEFILVIVIPMGVAMSYQSQSV